MKDELFYTVQRRLHFKDVHGNPAVSGWHKTWAKKIYEELSHANEAMNEYSKLNDKNWEYRLIELKMTNVLRTTYIYPHEQ